MASSWDWLSGLPWERWASIFWHSALVIGAAYAAVNPKWAWVYPALQAIGGFSPPPNLGAGPAQPKP